MPKNNLIEQVQRCLKNRTLTAKHIKRLRQQGMIDTLFTIGEEEITLLMYLVKENRLAEVKELLTEPNPANLMLKNKSGFNALAIAILAAGVRKSYDLAIIDELLKYNP